MIKKVSIALFILFSTTCHAQDKISIAYFNSDPHIVYDHSTNRISGALYTFLEEYIAPEMGVKFVWDIDPSNIPRQIELLKNEKIDAVALLVYTPERAGALSYTKENYYVSKTVIGVLRGNPLVKINTVDDILGLKIGYMSQTYISPFMRDKRIQFEFIHSADANLLNLKKLKNGRIDAIYIPDKAALLYDLKITSMEKDVRVIDLPEKAAHSHVVFSPGNRALAERYDKAFESVNGRKVYYELLGKYVDVNRL